MNLLFRLLPARMSRDGFTCGNKALDAYCERRPGSTREEEIPTLYRLDVSINFWRQIF